MNFHEHLLQLIGLGMLLYIAATLLAMGIAQLRYLRSQAAARSTAKMTGVMLELLDKRGTLEVGDLNKSRACRAALLALSERLGGQIAAQLRFAYRDLGFLRTDIAALSKAKGRGSSIKILINLRLLRLPLPEALWTMLLKSESLAVRWVAMEAFILTKRQAALASLVSFARRPENARVGVLTHLFSVYASLGSDALVGLLRDRSLPLMTQVALLKTVKNYPAAAAAEPVLAIAHHTTDNMLKCLAVAALASYPSPACLPVLRLAARDGEEALREAAALALGAVGGTDALALLNEMMIDSSYRVRRRAAESVLSQRPLSDALIAEVEHDSSHPCHAYVAAKLALTKRPEVTPNAA